MPTITYKEKQADVSFTDATIATTVMHEYEDPYTKIAEATDVSAIFVPETGELLLSAKAYEQLMAS